MILFIFKFQQLLYFPNKSGVNFTFLFDLLLGFHARIFACGYHRMFVTNVHERTLLLH